MSRQIAKKRLRRNLWWQFIQIAAIEDLTFSSATRWLTLYYDIRKQRYLTSRMITISKFNWITEIFSKLSDTRFRKFLRMNRKFFDQMLEIIKQNVVFYNDNNVNQSLVSRQLIVVLHKFDHDEANEDYINNASLWDVFEDYVYDCTRRVIIAFCQRRDEYVKWFTTKKRKFESMKNDARTDFIECINKANDIDIVLQRKSDEKYDDEIFFNRKKCYAMNLLEVCDFKRMFTYILIHWLNFQHDVRIFAFFVLNRRSQKYFSSDEYVLTNNAYVNVDYLISFYKNSATKISINKRFNLELFNIRVDIEHAFDILKDRWINLTKFCCCLYNNKQYEFVVHWIIVCVVLHNFLLDLSNAWNIEKD